LQSVKVFTHKN
jgi:hypothetical protein